MKIDILTKKGKYTPVIYCQHCDKPIKDGRKAIVKFWRKPSGSLPKVDYYLFVCHKDKCDLKSIGGMTSKYIWPWMSLGSFLVYLFKGSGLDWEKEVEKAHLMSKT